MVDVRFELEPNPLSTEDATDKKWNPVTALSSTPTPHELNGWEDTDEAEDWLMPLNHRVTPTESVILSNMNGLDVEIDGFSIRTTSRSDAVRKLLRYGVIVVTEMVKGFNLGRLDEVLSKMTGILGDTSQYSSVNSDSLKQDGSIINEETISNRKDKLIWYQTLRINKLSNVSLHNKTDLYRMCFFSAVADLPEELILKVGPGLVKKSQEYIDGFDEYLRQSVGVYRAGIKNLMNGLIGHAISVGFSSIEYRTYKACMEYMSKYVPLVYDDIEEIDTIVRKKHDQQH